MTTKKALIKFPTISKVSSAVVVIGVDQQGEVSTTRHLVSPLSNIIITSIDVFLTILVSNI